MTVSLNQHTYEMLKRDIMSFALKPGEPVSAAKIAERYQVSRTPAREALVKLQAEGLIKIYPQSKSVISKINRERMKQEWFVRRTLEMGMVDAFFDCVAPQDIQEMEDCVRKMEQAGAGAGVRTHESSYEYLCLDNAFHAVTYRVAKENLAAEIIEDTMVHYNRVRLLVDLEDRNWNRTVADHKLLIRLITTGEREQYREQLGEHLGHVLLDIRDLSKQMPELFE